jgi:hypothetical protein
VDTPSLALTLLQRHAAKQANFDEVMRALVQHDGYFVPLGFAPHLSRSEFERIVMLGKNGAPPPLELYLFTDEPCVDAVADKPLGGLVAPVSGIEVFCALPAELRKLKVNPGGAMEHFWFIDQGAMPLARLWGQAIRLETLLAESKNQPSPALNAALRSFEGFSLLTHPTGAVATAVGALGLQNPAMICTSPDSLARLQAQAPGTSATYLSGRALFDLLPRAGVDGMVFNLVGPGPSAALPLSAIAGILQLS